MPKREEKKSWPSASAPCRFAQDFEEPLGLVVVLGHEREREALEIGLPRAASVGSHDLHVAAA